MKITFDHQIFGLQEYGGISRYFYELSSELSGAIGQKVSVISPIYVNRYLANAPANLLILGIPIPKLPRTGRIFRAVNSFFVRPLMHFSQPDIVHETYYSSKRIAPSNAKVVLTVFDMIHEKFSEHFSAADMTSREKALAVARADHVICISEQTRRDLVDLLGVDPAKTSVVHLGFTLTKQVHGEFRPIVLPRPFLLYVGSRSGYKNFDGLLRAYAASARLRNDVDLICFGGGAFSNSEKKLIHSLELDVANVRQVAGDDNVLAGYYRAARAFIYPSLYEGFGIPPLEAMSFDCPVVCSGVSSIPEVVGDAGEMFDPHSTESMLTAIERVVADCKLRQDLIVRGRERIKHFSWERCAQETMHVYQRVLS